MSPMSQPGPATATDALAKYEPVIGLETHVELLSQTSRKLIVPVYHL